MNILVTGASGFLGRSVVAALSSRGHRVRANIRPTAAKADWPEAVEVSVCDLSQDNLAAILVGMDAVIHLAGHSSSLDGLNAAVLGTERLCAAVAPSHVKRFSHVSSLAVYDWSQTEGVLDERCALAGSTTAPTGYARSKLLQEEAVMRLRAADRIVTILRPGFIWGKGRLWVDGVGRRLPRAYLLVASEASVPLTHVTNCADAVVTAALGGEGVFNIVDEPPISRRSYLDAYITGSGASGLVIPLSYRSSVTLVSALCRILTGVFKLGRLPSLLNPVRFEGQFKPVVVSANKIRDELGWTPPLGFAEAAKRSFPIQT